MSDDKPRTWREKQAIARSARKGRGLRARKPVKVWRDRENGYFYLDDPRTPNITPRVVVARSPLKRSPKVTRVWRGQFRGLRFAPLNQ